MNLSFTVSGHVDIVDADTGEVILSEDNGVNYENFSVALAESMTAGPLNAGNAAGFIYSMAFGNGGTSVTPTGVVTYNPPNTVGMTAQLYNQTYSKVVNNNFSADLDTVNNNLQVLHVSGKAYSDILVSCQLNYSEPAGQQAFDNTTTFNDTYVFDEIGLLGASGQLLTHVIFNPVQKSLNRSFVIQYHVRIQTLTTLVSA